MTDPSPQPEPIEAEIVPDGPVVAPTADYDDRGVPSFDYVRDRIEGRAATSLGATELVGETPEGRSAEEQFTERERAAKAKLDEIRRSLS